MFGRGGIDNTNKNAYHLDSHSHTEGGVELAYILHVTLAIGILEIGLYKE